MDFPEGFDGCSARVRKIQGYAVALDAEVIADYGKNAKRRRLRPAIKRYEAIVAEVDAMLAGPVDDRSLADALRRLREALIDAVAVSTTDAADLERKRRAYADLSILDDEASWRFEYGMSVALQTDCDQLQLPDAQVERLTGMAPKLWISLDQASDGESMGNGTVH